MLLVKARKNVFQTQVYVPPDQNKQYQRTTWLNNSYSSIQKQHYSISIYYRKHHDYFLF